MQVNEYEINELKFKKKSSAHILYTLHLRVKLQLQLHFAICLSVLTLSFNFNFIIHFYFKNSNKPKSVIQYNIHNVLVIGRIERI